MTIKRFEDLEGWKISRELANVIYGYCRNSSLQHEFGFKDQIQRASISVMNNIAEGFERGSNKDFVKFLFIARGSAGEVRSMLYIAKDQNSISQEEFDVGLALCMRVSQLCWGLIKHLRNHSDWKTGEV